MTNFQREITQQLDFFDIVSFDVFDTLLLRPVMYPYDVFDIVEHEKGARGFAKARKNAAIASLEAVNNCNLGERTIVDIYRLIPSYSDCLEYEKEVESRLLVGNPETIYLFNKAKELGKRVIITSDMYLPAELIKKALVSCGIQGWDGFYLSCEQHARKSTGCLWDKVLTSEGCRPSRMLHIGDDLLSDFERPTEHGIIAYRYERIIEKFTRRNPWANVFLGSRPSLKKRNLMASVAVATHVYSCQKNGIDVKEWIACTFLAVVAYSYSQFIVCDARKRGLMKLLLLARDGYNLEPVINLLAPEIKTKYIYAPRRDYLVIEKNFIDNSYASKWKFLSAIVRGRPRKPSYEHRRIFVESMKHEWAESGSKWDPSDEELFLSGCAASPKLQAAIDGYSRFVREEYRKYFETLGISAADKVGLVDMTSVRGTAHRLVSIFSPARIHSYYYFRDTGRFCDFDFQDTSSYIVGSTTLCLDQVITEYFLSAPTPSIKAVRNCKPIYDDCSYYEYYKDKAVQQIRDPLVEICSMFNKWHIIDDIDALIETDWKEAHLQWIRKNFRSELSFMCSSYGVGNRFAVTLYDSLVHYWYSLRLWGHVIFAVHTSVKNLQIYYTFKLFGRIPILKLKLPF